MPFRLWRYLSQGALFRFGVAFLGLFSIYAVIDAIELTSHAPDTTKQLLQWLGCRAPFAVACIAPMALVLGILTSLSHHRLSGEWNALLASGIGPRRLLWVFLPIATGTTALSAFLLGQGGPSGLCSDAPVKPGASWLLCRDDLEQVNEEGFLVARIERSPLGDPIGFAAQNSAPLELSQPWQWRSETGWRRYAEKSPLLGLCPRVQISASTSALALLPFAHMSRAELRRAAHASGEKQGRRLAFEAQLALRQAIFLAPVALCLLSLGLGALGTQLTQGKATLMSIAAICSYWVCISLLWQAAGRGDIPAMVLGYGLPVGVSLAALVGLITRR